MRNARKVRESSCRINWVSINKFSTVFRASAPGWGKKSEEDPHNDGSEWDWWSYTGKERTECRSPSNANIVNYFDRRPWKFFRFPEKHWLSCIGREIGVKSVSTRVQVAQGFKLLQLIFQRIKNFIENVSAFTWQNSNSQETSLNHVKAFFSLNRLIESYSRLYAHKREAHIRNIYQSALPGFTAPSLILNKMLSLKRQRFLLHPKWINAKERNLYSTLSMIQKGELRGAKRNHFPSVVINRWK